MTSDPTTRIIACRICHSVRFWMRQDDRAGKLEVICDGCGKVFTALAIEAVPTS